MVIAIAVMIVVMMVMFVIKLIAVFY